MPPHEVALTLLAVKLHRTSQAAADALGITRQGLHRRLVKLEVLHGTKLWTGRSSLRLTDAGLVLLRDTHIDNGDVLG